MRGEGGAVRIFCPVAVHICAELIIAAVSETGRGRVVIFFGRNHYVLKRYCFLWSAMSQW